MKRILFTAAAIVLSASAWLPAQANAQPGVQNLGYQTVRHDRVWVPGHWESNGHRRVWRHGYWQPARYHAHPRPVYGYRAYGDRDRDGVPNYRDRDRDGDGVANRYDRNPNNPYRN